MIWISSPWISWVNFRRTKKPPFFLMKRRSMLGRGKGATWKFWFANQPEKVSPSQLRLLCRAISDNPFYIVLGSKSPQRKNSTFSERMKDNHTVSFCSGHSTTSAVMSFTKGASVSKEIHIFSFQVFESFWDQEHFITFLNTNLYFTFDRLNTWLQFTDRTKLFASA